MFAKSESFHQCLAFGASSSTCICVIEVSCNMFRSDWPHAQTLVLKPCKQCQHSGCTLVCSTWRLVTKYIPEHITVIFATTYSIPHCCPHQTSIACTRQNCVPLLQSLRPQLCSCCEMVNIMFHLNNISKNVVNTITLQDSARHAWQFNMMCIVWLWNLGFRRHWA